MLPILAEWGPEGARTVVLAYQVAFWSAAALAIGVGVLTAWRLRLPVARTAVLLACAAAGVAVGARVLYVLEYRDLFTGPEPLNAFTLAPEHFSLMGGVLAAAAVTVVGVRLLRLDLWRTADALAPGLALGIGVMRTGCFLAGCCFGVVTEGPFGWVFPPGSPPHLLQLFKGTIDLFGAPLPVYPTQLFELTGALVAAALAVVLIVRRAPSGVAFLSAAALFTAVRWAVWPLRYYPESFSGPGWEYPALYASVIAALVALAVWRVRAGVRAGARVRPDGGADDHSALDGK
jgi:phosphatidylglycerol:prolipoprotein diacylglycerol transferase